jgi:hypothetical protein
MTVYQVNKLCHRIYHDRQFREAVIADPVNAIKDWPLSEIERRAMLEGDIKYLYESGVHPFLLGHLTRWDVFGVTLQIYSDRIRSAKEPLIAIE